MKKVCVIGLGYMGLPTASLLANAGYDVVGFDVNEKKVEKIKQKELPFEEPGLNELVLQALTNNKLTVQTTIYPADMFIIAVPTPITQNKKADLSYVKKATESISKVLKKGNLVILESTVTPGTCERLLIPILSDSGLVAGVDYFISHCPERAIPGNTIHELVHNDRIIGGICQKSSKMTKKIYQSFVKGQIYLTDCTTAETVKLIENTTRDINIALANEFAKIAEEIGINIWEAIELANKHPRVNILKPGPGVGGHCIAIDPWFLTEFTDKARIIKTARTINDSMPQHVFDITKKLLTDIKNPTISILGLAYKADVDDARETPAKYLIDIAKKAGWNVKSHDPYVSDSEFEDSYKKLEDCIKGSDCIILTTNHKVYRRLEPTAIKTHMRNHYMIDTRNHLNHQKWQKEGFKTFLIGNGKTN